MFLLLYIQDGVKKDEESHSPEIFLHLPLSNHCLLYMFVLIKSKIYLNSPGLLTNHCYWQLIALSLLRGVFLHH